MKHNRNLIAHALILVAAISITASAWGHASAISSSPENGAVLSEVPAEISIQFNGPAKLISLTITNVDNETTKIDVSDAKSIDGLATVSIPPLQSSNYRVNWRAMGLDGHATSGQFDFVVSAAYE